MKKFIDFTYFEKVLTKIGNSNNDFKNNEQVLNNYIKKNKTCFKYVLNIFVYLEYFEK